MYLQYSMTSNSFITKLGVPFDKDYDLLFSFGLLLTVRVMSIWVSYSYPVRSNNINLESVASFHRSLLRSVQKSGDEREINNLSNLL